MDKQYFGALQDTNICSDCRRQEKYKGSWGLEQN